MYEALIHKLEILIGNETNFIANASNFSALVFTEMDRLNWVGFYLLTNGELLLGPFQGKTACIRIALGRGVCGTAAKNLETLVVPDVHAFPGHIACDAASKSEIVVPLIHGNSLYGVLDIDSPELDRFGDNEKKTLGKMCEILTNKSDIYSLKKYY